MKILYVEDEIAHVELAQRTLGEYFHDNFVFYHRESLRAALEFLEKETDIDLVLTDLRLPDGSGLDLLKKIKERRSSPAVVLVTGQGDQENAVAALKAGAADYLVKQSDYLHRLPVVISNAVAQNQLLRQQAALHQAEIRYQSLVERTPAVVFLDAADETETTLYISPRVKELTGYTPDEWRADLNIWINLIHPEDRKRIEEKDQQTHERGERFQEEYRLIRRDGRVIWIKEDTNLIRDKDGKPLYWQGLLLDITKEKENEAALQRQVEELAVLHSVAIASIESYSEDEIIEKVTRITGQLYPEVCGILQLNENGDTLTPHSSYSGADVSNWKNGYPITRGITGKAVLLGKTVRSGDITEEAEYIEIASDIRSELCVPIRVNERIIGVLNVESRKANAFEESDERILNTIAGGLGIALEKLRLYKEEQQRRHEAETLRRAGTVISSSLDPDTVCREILTALKQIILFNSGSVFLHEGNKLRVAMVEGYYHSEQLKNLTFPEDDEFFQVAKITRQPIIVEDVQKDSRFKYWGDSTSVRGWMVVPLISRGRVIGAITLDSLQPGAFNKNIGNTVMAFTYQAAAAIENARLFEEQRQRSRIIEALADIANEIATTRDVIPALDQIALRALDLLKANHVAIYLLQDDNITLKTVTAHGIYRKELLSHTRKVGEGITGNIFLNGKPEIIDDTKEDPRRIVVPGTPEEEKLETLMSSPLILRGRPIGVINAWRLKENGLFNESELNFLVSIAHQASICIESGRLFEETNRQAQEAAAIAEVGRDISATLELDIVLERIASYAMNLLHAETSAVYLADSSTSSLRAIAAIGLDSEEIKNDPVPIGTSILGNIALQNAGEIINDAANDARAIPVKGTEQNQLEHIMAVPILLKERHTGLLAIWRSGTGTEFIPRELDFLTSLARQAAVAIENARLYNETQRRLKELETINRISMSLRVTYSIDEILPILLNETLELVNTPHGSIWLYDQTSDKLFKRIATGAESKLKITSLSPSEGIVGHTFTTGKRYISPELRTDPLLSYENQESMTPGLGGVCIPIQSTAGPVGVLMIALATGRQIFEELHLLAILAEITGNAIHRAGLYQQSQEQVRRLTTLRDVDAAIASSFDLRLTLNILMDQTLTHLAVDAVDIALYHPELQSLTYLTGGGFRTPAPTRPQLRIGEGLAGQVIIRQQMYQVANLQDSSEVKKEPLIRREGFVAYIGIPLIVKGQVKGVFEAFHRSPLSPTADWMEFLYTLAGQAAIAIDNAQLFDNLQQSNQELIQAYDTTLEGWARALELRDRETEGHTRRVTDLTMRLAKYMDINDSDFVNIRRGVLLHDIGKMGVPDHILKKTGSLTPAEWSEMRKHPLYAYNLLSPIAYLRSALDIPYCHHEHWDGSGYPRGLKGEQIPLSARIFSVVDIWDALLSDRPYRKAWPHKKVIEYLKEISGTYLDPHIVEAFLKMIAEDESKTE